MSAARPNVSRATSASGSTQVRMYMLSTGAGRPAALAAASTRCRLQATASAEHQFNETPSAASAARRSISGPSAAR